MYQFIVNPSAGAGRGFRIWKKLESQLKKENREYQVFFTECKGDAAETAKKLTSEKEESKNLVVVGGEGTYNEVLNGIAFRGLLTMGYVPVGFRNALFSGFQSNRKVNAHIKKIFHPKHYDLLHYGVLTCGDDELLNRRFAGRCGIGLDAAICHNMLCCQMTKPMNRIHMSKAVKFILGLKQLILAKPVKGYIVFDGSKKVEFNHLYFLTFHVCGNNRRKNKQGNRDIDCGKMREYLANSSKKFHMIPVLLDVIMGVRKKERGIRIYECNEAKIHLSRPLAVHTDGESCMCQQELELRCIPKRIRMIGS